MVLRAIGYVAPAWVVLCATAHGAEQIDQITLERADDAVNA